MRPFSVSRTKAGILLLLTLACSPFIYGARLAAPPMLTWADVAEAGVWIQTEEEADVVLELRDPSGEWRVAAASQTTRLADYSVELRARRLAPSHSYSARIRIDGEVVGMGELNLRTASLRPAIGLEEDISILLCTPAAWPPAEWLVDLAHSSIPPLPFLSVWLGGSRVNEAEWGSAGGYLDGQRRYRQDPALGPLYRTIPQVALFTPLDHGLAGADKWLSTTPLAQDAHQTYWPNPLTHLVRSRSMGCWSLRHEDVDLFFLDTQSERDGFRNVILGEEQIDWLISALKLSAARFKVILLGSPLLSPSDVQGGFAQSAPLERERILERIKSLDVSGILVVSLAAGGPGELSLSIPTQGQPLYELSLGTGTLESAPTYKRPNYLREPGTLVSQPHYALLHFYGIRDARRLRISVMDQNGAEIWAQRPVWEASKD